MTANGEGEFIHIAVLPTDLTEGTYYFRAVTSHHDVLSPPLTVWGTAFTEGGGQGLRDEDDGLLAPMPTYASGVSSTAIPKTAPEPGPEPGPVSNVSISALMIIVVGLALIGIRVARKRIAGG